MFAYLAGAIFSILGFFALIIGFFSLRKWNWIRSTEVTSIHDATDENGVIKIEGRVMTAADFPMTSPITNTDCVAFKYSIQRRRSGDEVAVDYGNRHEPFILSDGTGRAFVVPETDNLSFSMEKVEYVNEEQFPKYINTKSSLAGKRQYKEGCLELGRLATIIGTTQPPDENSSTDIEFGPQSDFFFVSNQNPKETASRMLKKGMLLFSIGILFTILGIGILSTELGLFIIDLSTVTP